MSDAPSLHELIERQLKMAQQSGLYRQRNQPIITATSDQSLINFCSNDYLSLTAEPKLQAAYQEGFKRYPCGSSGSAVINGYHSTHQILEKTIAEALGVDDAVVFSSGFTANLAVTALFSSLKTPLILDKQVHASLYDGLRRTDAHFQRYRHQDMDSLAQQLSRARQSSEIGAMVLTEGLFSMSGQVASLNEIVGLCRQFNALCFVDEAHAFGVLGPQGLGVVNACGLSQEEVPLRLIAFGKALAGQGAVVAGKQAWIDALIQQGRSYIYSTTISPALAYGMTAAVNWVMQADDRRHKLQELVHYFKEKAQQSGLSWRDSSSPIQQLQLGCPKQAKDVAEFLFAQGIFCQAIRQPTVSLQETGLRVVLNYAHSQEEIDRLFKVLEDQSNHYVIE